MTNKKLTKSDDQLLKKNKELNDRLEKALKELETLKRHKDKLKSEVTKRSAELKEANDGLRRDIIEIKRSKSALQESENNLSSVYQTMSEGLAIHELVYDSSGEAVDYIITDVNPAYEKITGLQKKNIVGMIATSAYSVPEAPYIKIYSEVGSTGIPASFETYFPPMMKYFHISVFSPARGKFATLFSDITERKLAEEVLSFQSQLLSNVYDAVFSSDSNYMITYWNPAAEKMFGWTKEEVLGKNSGELLKPKIEGSTRNTERSKLRDAGHWLGGVEFKRKDGTYFFVEVNSTVLKNADGKDIGNVVVAHDITERRTAEDKLKKSEALYRAIGESIDYGIWICDADGKNIYASESYLNLVGMTQEQCSEFGWGDALHPDDAERTIAAWKECSKTGGVWDIEHRFRGVDGKWHPILARGIPIRDDKGKIIMWAGINLDISSIKQAQEDLRKSEEKFRNLVKYAPAVIYEMDIHGTKFMSVNDTMCRILGYSREELLQIKPMDLLDKQSRVSFGARVRRRLTGEKIEEDIEYRVRRKDGDWLETLITIGNINFSSDIPDSITVIAYDITERKKMEESLRESEKKFRELVKYAPTAIYELDFISRKFISVNDAMCKLSGYSREELLSLDALDLLVSESKALFLSRIKSCLNGEKPDENVEYEVKAKDGRLINAVLNMKFNFDEQGIPVGAMVVGHDITERKRAEAELRESETKFLSLFNLSPLPMALSTVDDGIFHDVNESFIRDSGFTKEEIVGRTSADLNLFIDSYTREHIIKEARNKGTIYGVPCDFRLKSGKILHCLLSSSTLPINGIFYLLSTIQDVTDILMTKEALQESEERFRTLSENIPDMILRFDKDLRLIYGNKAVTDRTNLPVDSLIGKTPKEYGANHDSSEKWERVAREVLDTGRPRRIEHTNSWLGNTKVFDTLLVPEMDKNGDVNSLISIARDITEMKRAENILRNSEQRLKYHFENSPLAVIEWDRDFQIIQWSNEAEKIFGLTRDETLGVRIDLLNIIYSEDLAKVEQTIERLVRGKELKVISQNRNITKTGEIKECIWYNSVLLDDTGEMNSVMSLVEDVTLLRSTEKELFESRESYKELVTNARTIIIKMDPSGRCTFVNEYALDFFGFNKEEMLGIPVMDTIMPKKESTGRDLLEMADEIIEDPDNFSVNINENIKKNGEVVWVEWHNKTLFDNSGIRTGHIGIGIDVTEKKKAEEALKENERKLWSVLDATLESIYMFDRNGIICMLNSTGVERLNKRSENEIIGHHYSEFMTPEIASARQEKLDQVFTRGIPLEFEDERDFRIFHHNYFPVFKDNLVVFVVTYSTDITDRKRAESKLIESEDRFRTIAESLTVMISIVRICDSAITFANEPFERTFGYGKDETQGNKYQDSFYNTNDFKNAVDILKDGGVIDNLEVMVKKADGTLFWIMLSVRKIKFLNEPSYLAVSIDITESKSTQLELLRLNRVLNAHSKSSQAMMHSTNEFDYINEICRIIIEDCGHSMVWVGYAQNDESKSVVPVAFHGLEDEYIDKLNISWADNERGRGPTGTAIRTGKVTMCKNMLTDPAFKPWREAAIQNGYASSLVFPLFSEGKAFGAISIYSKEPDPFLESEIKLLSDLVDDLAYGISFLRLEESERAATNAIKENEIKLKELVITKDKFFNIVAHDLKNPFTSLLGASELLYSNISEMTPENVRKLALILNDSAKGGYAILQNLLDWSRSQTGLIKYNPENINLKLLINENIENLQLQIANKEINMRSELSEDLFICADQNMINTVLRNLLSNAVKYTFKNGTILVKVSRTAEEVVVSVKDSGIGITRDVLDNLFRLENSLSLPGTEKEKGTGLGLKLCKEFTEMMGGKIWVESNLGQGSEFKFTIPFNSDKNQEINSQLIKTN
jgi:PAS domain S-box-containing protein